MRQEAQADQPSARTLIHADVAVIGAGTAGLAAYRAARAAGKRAVLIEGGLGGTTCARVGCMPSKLLIAAAEAAHEARHTAPFGVHVEGGIRIDGPAVMTRVKQERDRFVGRVLHRASTIPADDRLAGFARFVADNLLEVGENIAVEASAIVIATGSAPSIPKALTVFGDRLVVNDDVFEWTDLPRRVAVFGPGVIGLELGQALARLGVHIRIFGLGGGVGPITDPEVASNVTAAFQEEFYIDPDAKINGMQRDGDEAVITFVDLAGQIVTERFDFVLAATGRKPRVQSLALQNTSLEIDSDGVPFFDSATLRCGDSSIYIAGDANGILPLLHEAADEGKLAGANAAALNGDKALKRRAPISIVFSDPQIALVGKRFADLEPDAFVTGIMNFDDQGRSRIMRKNRGLMHLYADKSSGVLLGAEWSGPRAEHIAHLLAWSMQQSLTVAAMLDMPFYHPAIEEGLGSALQDAMEKLRQHAQHRSVMPAASMA